jgi:hypothetical protein
MAGLVLCRQGPERRSPGSDRVTKCVAGQTGECSNSTVTPGWYTERLPGLGALLDRWQSVVSSPPTDANSTSRSRSSGWARGGAMPSAPATCHPPTRPSGPRARIWAWPRSRQPQEKPGHLGSAWILPGGCGGGQARVPSASSRRSPSSPPRFRVPGRMAVGRRACRAAATALAQPPAGSARHCRPPRPRWHKRERHRAGA